MFREDKCVEKNRLKNVALTVVSWGRERKGSSEKGERMEKGRRRPLDPAEDGGKVDMWANLLIRTSTL